MDDASPQVRLADFTGDTKNEHIRSAKEVLEALPPPDNQKKAAEADTDTQAA